MADVLTSVLAFGIGGLIAYLVWVGARRYRDYHAGAGLVPNTAHVAYKTTAVVCRPEAVGVVRWLAEFDGLRVTKSDGYVCGVTAVTFTTPDGFTLHIILRRLAAFWRSVCDEDVIDGVTHLTWRGDDEPIVQVQFGEPGDDDFGVPRYALLFETLDALAAFDRFIQTGREPQTPPDVRSAADVEDLR